MILKKKNLKKTTLCYLLLIPILFFILLPFFWTVVTAFKPESEIIKSPISYLPKPVTFENFKTIWDSIGFSRFFFNSTLVCVISVFFIVVFAVMTGYAMQRFRFKGRQLFMIALLCTQFIPTSMLLIPLATLYRNLGIINTFSCLIITYITFELPFAAILMRGFVSSVPFEVEEAAMIDGCNRVQAILQVVIPVLIPGIVAAGAFAFVGCWNEFLFALMFTSSNSHFTIPVGLSYMRGQYAVAYGSLAAGSLIALLPPVLLFAYLQKYLVQGLSAGAIKG